MRPTRNEFRKRLATAAGRAQLGIDLSAEQAAQILADDELLNTWYAKHGDPLSSEPQGDARPRQPRAASWLGAIIDQAGRRLVVALGATGWVSRGVRGIIDKTTRKQRLTAAIASGMLIVVIAGGFVAVAVAANVQRNSVIQAEVAAKAKKKAADEAAEKVAGAKRLALARGDGPAALLASRDIPRAVAALGTLEQAQTRQAAAAEKAKDDLFAQALEAVGNGGPTEGTRKEAREWCATINAQWNDPAQRFDAIFKLRTGTVAYSKMPQAIVAYCPEVQAALDYSNGLLASGNHRVGAGGITPGTYHTLQTNVAECYWERHTGGGDIIANDFITVAPDGVEVTVYDGEGVSFQGCGLWYRVG